jgi:hypothetical protein
MSARYSDAGNNHEALLAALHRIAKECDLPDSNGVRLTPEAALTAIGRFARAAIVKAAQP